VTLLGFADPLPACPCRVVVAGTSGSGKTTWAGRIAEQLGVPHVEIDALFHGPGWVPRPSFLADVRAFSAQPAWVTEWQYSEARPLLLERADLLVWLDLPRRTVMRQVLLRTLTRRWRRQPLWSGNIEPPLWTIATDQDHIVRWAWSTHPTTARRVRAAAVQRPDLPVVHLRSNAEAGAWSAGPLAQAARAGGP
jgi:adenylate kinase family enzyme